MTIAEIERAIKSKVRMEKYRAKEKAIFDYMLADLIGSSVARLFSSNINYPTIEEVYPSIFIDDIEQKKQEKEKKITELSILRFKEFTKSFNNKYKGVRNT